MSTLLHVHLSLVTIPVSAWMGDRLRTGKNASVQNQALRSTQPDPPSVGRLD